MFESLAAFVGTDFGKFCVALAVGSAILLTLAFFTHKHR
jgi:hypothetical protein